MQDRIVKMSGIQPQNRLFVLGNGFDLKHGLPTSFDPDFKEVAVGNESNNLFWDLYQSESAEIWSDFELLLGRPDFDNLREIFDGYEPDYLSDHESDRNSSITQVDISGKLNDSLSEFATKAENKLTSIKPTEYFQKLLSSNSHYLNFNYTHTLETVYKIPVGQVLHIHGEVGGNSKLILGYDATDFDAGKITEDISGQGRLVSTTKYIDGIEDYYIRTAYETLLGKIKSWAKPIQTERLMEFVKGITINEVIVIGFSFGKVDAAYFELIQQKFTDCRFIIVAHKKEAAESYENNIKKYYKIENYNIGLLENIQVEK